MLDHDGGASIANLPHCPQSQQTNSILMVLTRDLDPVRPSGQDCNGPGSRIGTLRAIVAAVRGGNRVALFRLTSLLEQRAYFRCALKFMLRVLLPFRNKWPLQCVLFDDNVAIGALLCHIEETSPSAVYFDTVRCYAAIKKVRSAFPNLRLVCDFDDLMSRRMSELRKLNSGFSLGYLREYVPGWLRRRLEGGTISKIVFGYEGTQLIRFEQEIRRMVQGVVLVSSRDAAALLESGSDNYSEVTVAPPPFRLRKRVERPAPPYRFVFIGSDKQLQNRLTIEWLLQLWKQDKLTYPLYICGLQVRSYELVKNVFWEGFVNDVRDVYTSNSILLSPCFLAGGVKTKMCEALSYGVIPLGNRISFEGIDAENNGLAMSEEKLISTIRSIEQNLSGLTINARQLQDYLIERHGVESYEARWRGLLAPSHPIAISQGHTD